MIPEPFLSWFHALLLMLRENDEKALFLLLLVEEAGIPLPAPGDIVIMYAGMRIAQGEMTWLEAGVSVVLAVQLGSTILYAISRKFGHTILFRYGRFIHLDQSKLTKVEGWIQRHGAVMVLVGRLTPGLRTPTSIMAGTFEIRFPQFLFFATTAAVTWSIFWLGSGYFFGRQMVPMLRYFHYSGYLFAAAALLFIGWALIRRRQRHSKRQRHKRRIASETGETEGV